MRGRRLAPVLMSGWLLMLPPIPRDPALPVERWKVERAFAEVGDCERAKRDFYVYWHSVVQGYDDNPEALPPSLAASHDQAEDARCIPSRNVGSPKTGGEPAA